MGVVQQVGTPILIYSSCGDRGCSEFPETFAEGTDSQVLLSEFNWAGLGRGQAYAILMGHPSPFSQGDSDAASVTQVGSPAMGNQPHSFLGSQKVMGEDPGPLTSRYAMCCPHHKVGCRLLNGLVLRVFEPPSVDGSHLTFILSHPALRVEVQNKWVELCL